MTTLAVSDKCIPEWLSISHSLQDWGLVYWKDACLVWNPESCVTAARCSCARVVHWKVKSPAAWQMSGSNCLSSKTSQTAPFTFIPGCTKMHQCTSAWRHRLKPKRRNMFIRNQRETMSWNGIWLKYGQQPAELHWSIDKSVTRLFYCVSQSQKTNTLNICYDVFLYDM